MPVINMNPTYTALIELLRAGEIPPATDELRLKEAENTQITVRLRPETRTFFDACAERLGVTRAGLFNLMVDGLMLETLDNTAHKAVTLYERFCLLMDAHGLDVMDQACLLKPWGFRSGLLASRERTLDLLNIPLLQQLADWFHVDVDWLRGRAPHPVCIPAGDSADNWSAVIKSLRTFPVMDESGEPLDLIFCFSHSSGESVHNMGLCLRYRRIIHDVSVSSVIWYGTANWGEPDTQEIYRQLKSLVTVSPGGHPVRPPQEAYPQVRSRYFRLSARQMQRLSRGEILPVMALNKPRGEYPGI